MVPVFADDFQSYQAHLDSMPSVMGAQIGSACARPLLVKDRGITRLDADDLPCIRLGRKSVSIHITALASMRSPMEERA
jgi:hypothetical protein